MDQEPKTPLKTLIHPDQLLLRLLFIVIKPNQTRSNFKTHTKKTSPMENTNCDNHLIDVHEGHIGEDSE